MAVGWKGVVLMASGAGVREHMPAGTSWHVVWHRLWKCTEVSHVNMAEPPCAQEWKPDHSACPLFSCRRFHISWLSWLVPVAALYVFVLCFAQWPHARERSLRLYVSWCLTVSCLRLAEIQVVPVFLPPDEDSVQWAVSAETVSLLFSHFWG